MGEVAYIVFVAYPTTNEGGDPQHWALFKAWSGPDGSRFSHMAVGALIMVPYLWVTVRGTRMRGRESSSLWLVGSGVGGIGGLAEGE